MWTQPATCWLPFPIFSHFLFNNCSFRDDPQMGPPLAQGVVSILHPHYRERSESTQPLSQLNTLTQHKSHHRHLTGTTCRRAPPHTPAPKGLGIVETARSGRLHTELGFSRVSAATQDSTAHNPSSPALGSPQCGHHQAAEQASRSERDKTDHGVVMWGHTQGATCFGHLQKHGSQVETDSSVTPTPTQHNTPRVRKGYDSHN